MIPEKFGDASDDEKGVRNSHQGENGGENLARCGGGVLRTIPDGGDHFGEFIYSLPHVIRVSYSNDFEAK